MSNIDLTKVAPDLLQVIGLTLPTVAIFIALRGRGANPATYEKIGLGVSLVALLLVVLAAGFNVSYLALSRNDWSVFTAIGLYLSSLAALTISVGLLLTGNLGLWYRIARLIDRIKGRN